MNVSAAAKHGSSSSLSIRRRVERKITRVSTHIGAAGAFVAIGAYLAGFLPDLQEARETNQQILAEITCAGADCDSTTFSKDWELQGANYVIDTQTRYVFNVPAPQSSAPRLLMIEFSDPSFIARFRQPESFRTPDGEVWRLYSHSATVEKRPVEILVGYATKAPWKMIDTPQSLVSQVDEKLKQEGERIAEVLTSSSIVVRQKPIQNVSADGYEVVDATTGKLMTWGSWLPVFLPRNVNFLRPGTQLRILDQQLCLLRTDANERLLVTSVVAVGHFWLVVLIPIIGFVSSAAVTRWASRRFLRNYFALADIRLPTTEEALKHGENQTVEFKRSLSDDSAKSGGPERELLESVAAFANTNDGLILIGVDNEGKIRGLPLAYKERDRFEQKIHQMVRSRIKPTPPTQVAFEEVNGSHVARITVARGNAVYLLNGVIYIRDGSTDVPAQPEDVTRLVAECIA
jgi:Putative DNA-binding domain